MSNLLDKGVIIGPLLGSKIFSFNFDFDEWPSTHEDSSKYSRPYNDSIFNLRYCYRNIFPEDKFSIKSVAESLEVLDSTKVFKINYKINILPMVDEHVIEDENGNNVIYNGGYSFLETCMKSDQLDIFDVENF